MQWSDVSKDWPAFQNSIKARWPEVDQQTVADLSGDRKAFNAYLGQTLGLTPREAEEQIYEWLQGPLPLDAAASPVRDNRTLSESRAHIPEGEDVYSDDQAFGDDDKSDRPIGRDLAKN